MHEFITKLRKTPGNGLTLSIYSDHYRVTYQDLCIKAHLSGAKIFAYDLVIFNSSTPTFSISTDLLTIREQRLLKESFESLLDIADKHENAKARERLENQNRITIAKIREYLNK